MTLRKYASGNIQLLYVVGERWYQILVTIMMKMKMMIEEEVTFEAKEIRITSEGGVWSDIVRRFNLGMCTHDGIAHEKTTSILATTQEYGRQGGLS